MWELRVLQALLPRKKRTTQNKESLREGMREQVQG